MSTSSMDTRSTDPGPWATGLAVFAGAMMMVLGTFHALQGIVALVNDDFFVVGVNYTYEFDVTAWGWIHLLLGIVVAAAGIGVISGQTWARVVAIAVVSLTMIANFIWLPYYPLWAMLIIALDVAVIWAVSVYEPAR